MADFDAVGVLFLDPYLYLQLLLLHFADLPNSSCQNPFKYSKTVVAVVFWSTLQLGSDFGLQNMHSTPRFCLTRSLCVCMFIFAICGLLFVAKKLKYSVFPTPSTNPFSVCRNACHAHPLFVSLYSLAKLCL